MEIRHLVTFLSVVEHRNFTRAGEYLKYTQGTITNHIQALEVELNSPLFNRLGKKVFLTKTGENLIFYAKEIIRLSQEALESCTVNLNFDTIRLGANESLMIYRLPNILNDFKTLYPQVNIELYPGDNKKLRDKLKKGEIDLSFLLDIEKSDYELTINKLVCEKLVLIAPPNHPLTKKQIVNPIDLQGETLLLTEQGSYRDFLEQKISENDIFCSKIDFENLEAIKQCVMAGVGISYLTEVAVINELQKGKLVALPWNYHEDIVATQLAFHKNKWISPAMEKLIEIIKNHARYW
ncbi:LysR family transcriptional regulator [Lysinibacillus capsici]|uniref:LysR family transcriptional regulator n=1 Tax=Lysinibacillus capsici TaxID=2115968 RepID=UPI002152AEC8|nr:LysR family transcriptional regulator [Lysinibacillus capsici]MCR6522122.1 LysR family transcriptional regulator [Lysinibacillus capsici]